MYLTASGKARLCAEHLPRKTLLLMKWWTLILLSALLQANVNGLAQGKITLKEKNATLETLFSKIQKQSGYAIWYDKALLAHTRPITINLKGVSLEQALEACCRNQPLSWTITEHMVVIRSGTPSPPETIPRQPKFTLRGTVINDRGEPLPGATVTIKGSQYSAAADNKGIFELPYLEGAETIIASNVGYEQQEIAVGFRKAIVIQLHPVVSKLDEVQVIGYGTTTKRLSTGSVSKVSSEEIEKQPVTNVLSALSGRAAGVFVQTTNGLPGGNIKVQIRGQGSVAAGTDPLFIVDGVPFTSSPLNAINGQFINANGMVSPLNSIPPADIESIEILKDADATAIYGSRGANGVVLITTKKGQAGDTRLNISFSQGFSKSGNLPVYLGLKDYLEMRRQAFANDGVTPTATNAPDLLVWDTTHATDWGKYISGKTDPVTEASATLSAGNNTTRFLFGTNYRKEASMLAGDGSYKRFGGLLNIEHSSKNKKFNSFFSVNYAIDNNKLPKYIDIITIPSLPPNYPIYNPDGSLNWFSTNPLSYQQQKSASKTERFTANASLNYSIVPGLQVKSNLGYNRMSMNMISTLPQSSQNPAYAPVSTADFGANTATIILIEPQLNYKRIIGRNSIGLLLGCTYQQSITEGHSIQGTDYSNETLLENLAAAGRISSKLNNYTAYKYISFFSRLSWINNDRYLVSINFRRDGSSKFGPGRRFGNFGALGTGWIFSQEPFFKNNSSIISFGKIRASYGITGNDQITPYQYLASYSNASTYQGFSTIKPARIANDDYQWETTRKLEGALELGLFKDRIFLTAAYYYNRSGNQLVNYPIPYLTGFSNYQANLPAVIINQGWEFDFNTRSIQSKHFSWTTSFNITLPGNKLAAYPNLAISSYANTYVVGEDLSIVKGYHFMGVDPQTGVARFDDINRDGRISYPGDLIVLGKTSPDYFGGLRNSLQYKWFQLDLFFQFASQHGLTDGAYTAVPGFTSNRLNDILGWWEKPGDIAATQKSTQSYSTDAGKASDLLGAANSNANFINTSYLRFKTLSLHYSLAEKLLSKINITRAKLFIQGQNLFTICRTRNIDPETTMRGSNIPVLKTWVAGVSITL
jgi:TonB-linked SusC/RagA family outer membrane protein